MINTLKIWIKDGEKSIQMETKIDYTPSKGLIIYKPISGKIGTVHYDENGFTANLESVLNPTNPKEQIEYLKTIGFTEI